MVAIKGDGEYFCACRAVCTSAKQYHSAPLDTIAAYSSVHILFLSINCINNCVPITCLLA